MKKTKKIPISFSPENQEEIADLVDLMGITDVYGDIPKAVRFGINLARSAARNPEKVYQRLTEDEMTIYFQTIQRAEIKRRKLEKAEKLQNEAEKV